MAGEAKLAQQQQPSPPSVAVASSSSSSFPTTLADVFAAVPEIADLVVKELDPIYAERLMVETNPALTAFFSSAAGGGLQRYMKISREGKQERKRIARLPDEPRLLAGEWGKRLLGKRLVAEDVQGDKNMTFKRSDLPEPYRFLNGVDDCMFYKNRLNIQSAKGIVIWLSYG